MSCIMTELGIKWRNGVSVLRSVVAFSAFLAGFLLSSSVSASTLPPVDFRRGDQVLAVGVLDFSFDYAVTEQFSLGATLNPGISRYQWFDPLLSPFAAAVRSTYRLGEAPNGLSYGVTLSSGIVMAVPYTMCGPDCRPYDLSLGFPFLLKGQYRAFLQPAFNVTKTVGEILSVRATLGPVLLLNGAVGFEPVLVPIWPNLEIVFRVSPRSEITLLGNSIIGWRGIF